MVPPPLLSLHELSFLRRAAEMTKPEDVFEWREMTAAMRWDARGDGQGC
jgi:hypothetical protein